jgi:protein KTI12
MPCLILTGYPCSGKTTLANLIRDVALEHFKDSISNVVIVRDATSPSSAYGDSFVEKSARASLKSDFDRVVNRTATTPGGGGSAEGTHQTLVILDSLNYIKGYRYELYCISKAAQQRHGVVWVLNTVETVLRWNRDRLDDGANEKYDEALLRELVARYEPPDARNRWDSPLYEIDVRPTSDPTVRAEGVDNEPSSKSKPSVLEEVLEHSVYDMHKLSSTLPDKANPTSAAESTTNLDIVPPSGSQTSPFDVSPMPGRAKPKRAVFKRPTKKQNAAPSTSHRASVHVNESPEGTGPATDSEVQTADPVATDTAHTDSASRSGDGAYVTSTTAKTLEERLLEMLRSFLSDDNKPLQAGTSTTRHDVSDPNTLNKIDSVTLQVCDALSKSGVSGGGGGTMPTPISLFGETFARPNPGTHRTMSLDELRRLRRQYMQWIAAYPPDDVDTTSPPSIVRSFLAYMDVQR